MEALPDEIWTRILQTGINIGNFNPLDLCSLAIVCRRAKRISADSRLWILLMERDFPNQGVNGHVNFKDLYKTRFEKEVSRREAERRRQKMRIASVIHSYMLRRHKYGKLLESERDAAVAIKEQLSVLARSSQASVALQIWQPDAVNTHHQKVVQQVPVDLAGQVNSLKMKLQERHQYMRTYENILKSCEKFINSYQDKLSILTYKPLDVIEEMKAHRSGALGREVKISSNQRQQKKAKTKT